MPKHSSLSPSCLITSQETRSLVIRNRSLHGCVHTAILNELLEVLEKAKASRSLLIPRFIVLHSVQILLLSHNQCFSVCMITRLTLVDVDKWLEL